LDQYNTENEAQDAANAVIACADPDGVAPRIETYEVEISD
jgi:hypothetical protein